MEYCQGQFLEDLCTRDCLLQLVGARPVPLRRLLLSVCGKSCYCFYCFLARDLYCGSARMPIGFTLRLACCCCSCCCCCICVDFVSLSTIVASCRANFDVIAWQTKSLVNSNSIAPAQFNTDARPRERPIICLCLLLLLSLRLTSEVTTFLAMFAPVVLGHLPELS